MSCIQKTDALVLIYSDPYGIDEIYEFLLSKSVSCVSAEKYSESKIVKIVIGTVFSFENKKFQNVKHVINVSSDTVDLESRAKMLQSGILGMISSLIIK